MAVGAVEADNSGSPGDDLTQYGYNGTSRLVQSKLVPPNFESHRDIDGDGTYAGLDRFGRDKLLHWARLVSGIYTYRDRFDYTYDYAGNRTSRTVRLDKVPGEASGTDIRDQAYFYDGLHRLSAVQQGTDTGNDGDIDTLKFAQDWTLDQLGNWDEFDQDDDGNLSSVELQQSRSHNEVNETTSIGIQTGGNGTNWADPAHDDAGNMTTMPQPKAPANGYTAKYDAWNRLIELKDGSTVVTTNEYDGLHRRIVRDETGGSGDHRHFYYNESWQVLEERVEESGSIKSDPLAQYVYHPYYIDAIALRYYDSDTSGTGIEEHYYLQDANFNVTAIIDDAGAVLERYSYTPYGVVTILDADFSTDANNISDIGNELLYTGRRLDPETGLQHNRNRFYHAPMGRWVNRDPIVYDGGMNLCEYVGGMPTMQTDPAGLKIHVGGGVNFRRYIAGLLMELCSLVRVQADGTVVLLEGPPEANEQISCDCLRQLVNGRHLNEIVLGHQGGRQFTAPNNPGEENPGGVGTGGTTNFNPTICLYQRIDGEWHPIPSSIVLAHELCGHSLPMNLAKQMPPGPPLERGGPPQDEIFALTMEGVIREEKGCPARTGDEKFAPCPKPAPPGPPVSPGPPNLPWFPRNVLFGQLR